MSIASTIPDPSILSAALGHHQAGRWQQAEYLYRQILQQAPNDANALSFLGLLIQQTGKHAEAWDLLTRAIYRNPRHPVCYRNLGVAWKLEGELDAAIEAFQKALQLDSNYAEAYNDLGDCLHEQGRFIEAEESYRKALLVKNDFAEAYINLGLTQRAQGNMAEAEISFRRALDINPELATAHNNLGVLLHQQVRLAEAESSIQRALQIAPDYVNALHNWGLILLDMGRLDEASANCSRLLALAPESAEVHFQHAFLLLLQGDYQRGWKEYEYRWQLPQHEPRPHFIEPLWNGDADLRNKTILVYAEQGLGDTIQFVRYTAHLAARGAIVYLLVPASLQSLLQQCEGIAKAITPTDSFPAFDYHCPLLSLPAACGTSLATVPANTPYVFVAEERRQLWQSRIGNQQARRVGLVWAGSAHNSASNRTIDQFRSIDFSQLFPLLDVEGLEFYSLQLGDEAHSQLHAHPRVIDLTGDIHDFHDTAALLAQLDLVIAVDTAVAHLAGAMGKTVWLLNRFNTCWRWLLGREDSPWYPSMRLFRQPAFGDWDSVIAQVRAALVQFATSSAPLPVVTVQHAIVLSEAVSPVADNDAIQMWQNVLAHYQTGQFEQASSLCKLLLDKQPQHAGAWNMAGLLANRNGQDAIAIDAIQQAISFDPRNPFYYRNLGIMLRRTNAEAAIAAFQKVLTLDDNAFATYFDLGDCLLAQGHFDEAEVNYRRALAIKPDFVEARINLGLIQKGQLRLAEAEDSYRQALAIKPDSAIANANLAVILQEQGRLHEAEQCCRLALADDPSCVPAYHNLAITLRDMGRVQEAEASCRHALQLHPEHLDASFLLAMLLLLQGNYLEGWKYYEYRWFSYGHQPQVELIQPMWRGDADLYGKAILLHAEQGYGDTLQFVRYAKLLTARGATVYLLAPPPLKSLLERCVGVAAVFMAEDPEPSFDFHCPLMSLPLALRTELATVPADVPYLHCDPERVRQWQEKLGEKNALRVGLVWAGNARRHLPLALSVDQQRSMHFTQLAPLLEVAGVEFFSLQLGDEAKVQLQDHPKVVDYTAQLADFHDTAALISHLDLVISVDTAVAHLACGLGKPLWLLNRFNTCWRWLRDRTDSPWYPTARIFRQPVFGDWESVIANVRQALQEQVPSIKHVAATTASLSVSQIESSMPLLQQLQAAVAHHQAGRLPQAEALYRHIISLHPNQPEALHFLGMLVHQTGQHREAINLILGAIDADPRNPLFPYNLGTIYRKIKELPEAINSYQRAVQLKPDFTDAHYRLGYSLQQAGRLADAEASYRQALQLQPGLLPALNNLGSILHDTDRNMEAEACFRQALQVNPDYTDAQVNLGNVLRDTGRVIDAEATYRRALLINPNYAEAYSNLAGMLIAQRRYAEAEGAYRRALELKPDFAELHNNLSVALNEQGRFIEAGASCRQALSLRSGFAAPYSNLGLALKGQGSLQEAETAFRQALALDDGVDEVHDNLANLLRDMGRLSEAERSFQRAIEINPANALTQLNYAMLLLQLGDFKQGWQKYEYRWQIAKNNLSQPRFSQPLWLGDADLRGKTILLHAEQGFGDTLQFVRYASLLASDGAIVLLLVPATLKPLLTRCAGVASVFSPDAVLPSFDYHCPLLSLPLACHTTLETIPAFVPYLTPSAVALDRWRELVGERRGLRVGLVWAGNPRKEQPAAHALDRLRSIGFDRLRQLLTVPGIEFFNLQLHEVNDWQLKDYPQVRDLTAEIHDFQDTAALMANLDLIITVDTAAAHLAGAIGRPVWLLNRYNTCWRWLNNRSDSPWYPSMCIFRQPQFGDWDSVIADVQQALILLVTGKPIVIDSIAKITT